MRATVRFSILFPIILVGTYLAVSVLGAFYPGKVARQKSTESLVRIGLIQGPIHTDFVLPLTPQTRSQYGFMALDDFPIYHPQA